MRQITKSVKSELDQAMKLNMQGDDDVSLDASPSVRVRQRLRGSKAELSWLMRTTYISNDAGGGGSGGSGTAPKGLREKEAKALRDAGLEEATEVADPLQAQIQEIEVGMNDNERRPK